MDLFNPRPHGAEPAGSEMSPPPTGPSKSRGNALKHGLTATTLLPAALGTEILERHRQLLRNEWQPRTPTQEFLVNELARHAAALERAEIAEAAVLRAGARAAVLLLPPPSGGTPDLAAAQDILLTGAISTDALERLTRYRRAHEKAWHQALQRLRELMDVPQPKAPSPAKPQLSFTEEDCCKYLQERFQNPAWRCPNCGHAHGYWLATRQRWECAGCGRQVGLRTGTVMERSSLALTVWFAAIGAMLENPNSTLAELASVTGIHREATLRRVRNRIGKALKGSPRTDLWGGVDPLLLDLKTARSGPPWTVAAS